MRQSQLAKCWVYLGPIAFLLAVSTVLQSQGGPPLPDSLFQEGRPHIASYYSIFLLAPMLIGLAAIASIYAYRSESPAWSGRLPIIADDPDNPADPPALLIKIYQAFFLVGFILVPAYALGHANRVVLNRTVIWNEAAGPENAFATKYSLLASPFQPRVDRTMRPDPNGASPRLWLADREGDPKKAVHPDFSSPNPRELSPACKEKATACRGVEWFHPWSLVATGLLSTLAGLAFLWLFLSLFRSRSGLPQAQGRAVPRAPGAPTS